MKRTLLAALVLCCAAVAPWALAADVGVSVQISEPGVFGRIDIGKYPQPQVILSAPVIALPPPMPPPTPVEPLYLWVPPEHQQHWAKYCHEYHACAQPVYFVHHDWYREHVLKEHVVEDHRHDKDRDRDERDREDHDRGRGRD